MAGKKHRPVLYELIRRRGAAEPPKPRSASPNDAAPPAPAAPPPPRPVAAPRITPPPAVQPAVIAGNSATRAPRPPLLNLRSNRSWLESLPSLQLPSRPLLTFGVVGGVSVLLIFLMIYRLAQGPPPGSSDDSFLSDTAAPSPAPTKPLPTALPGAARPKPGGESGVATPTHPPAPEPPRTSEPQNKPERNDKPQPKDEPPAPAAQPQLEKGSHYIVVQHFKKDKQTAAQEALAFLQSKGIACVLLEGRRDIKLVVSESFQLEQKDAPAREKAKQRIEQVKQTIKRLGKEYAKTGGYAFDQCYEQKF